MTGSGTPGGDSAAAEHLAAPPEPSSLPAQKTHSRRSRVSWLRGLGAETAKLLRGIGSPVIRLSRGVATVIVKPWRGHGRRWLLGFSIVLLAAITGTAGLIVGETGVVALGLMPAPRQQPASSITLLAGADALDCPDGEPVDELKAGRRLLAVGRNSESSYLAVLSPDDAAQVLWLAWGVVRVDEGQKTLRSLPVGECAFSEDESEDDDYYDTGDDPATDDDEYDVRDDDYDYGDDYAGTYGQGTGGSSSGQVDDDESDDTDPGADDPDPSDPDPTHPPETPDVTKPQVTVAGFTNKVIAAESGHGCPTVARTTVTATDDRGTVTVVASSSAGNRITITAGQKSGSSTVYEIGTSHTATRNRTELVTFTATDAAGNTQTASRSIELAASC